MQVYFWQIFILAIIQSIAELFPISSSAHVILAEKWMKLDPSAPEMIALLILLHTGTMSAVCIYFWKRWRKWTFHELKILGIATFFTGIMGLALKILIEELLFKKCLGKPFLEVENLFKNLSLIAIALFLSGMLVFYTGLKSPQGNKKMTLLAGIKMGLIQGLCLPFRGFSRSGATISVGLLSGVQREQVEEMSFAMGFILTPVALLYQILKIFKQTPEVFVQKMQELFLTGTFAFFLSFLAGLVALKWLSIWLKRNYWKYFGLYGISLGAGILIYLSLS